MQHQDPFAPHWSPDLRWWWDGARWVPASQAPMPPPPAMPPGYYQMPPPLDLKPSPGLRPFLIVMLAVATAIWGFMTLFATLGDIQGISEGQTDPGPYVLWIVFSLLLGLAVAGVVGVVRRSSWARWVSLAPGLQAR